MEFDDIRTYNFRPDLSNGLTGNEMITVLHPGKMMHGRCCYYDQIVVIHLLYKQKQF